MSAVRGATPPKRTLASRRIALLLTALLIAMIAVTARTLYLQSAKTFTLKGVARSQQQNSQALPAVRGDIVDRNGQEFAVGEEGVTFWANPSQIKDPAETSDQIAKLLNMSDATKLRLITRLSDPSKGFVYVARQVPRRFADDIINAKITGIGHYDEEKRVYPLAKVGAQIVGYSGIDSTGLAGAEMLYDDVLKGHSGKQVVVKGAAGTPLDVVKLEREVDGRRVQLTIDATIQTQAERVLQNTMRQYSAKAATAVVMDPRTGEIYALANVPSVDANHFDQVGKGTRAELVDKQRNRAITDTFEPGSTFKVVTVSGALEDKLVKPTTSFLLQPFIQVADRKIENSHPRPTMRMSVREILIESDNVGTVTIGLLLGKDRLDHWARKFGFGKRTGVEGAGLPNPPKGTGFGEVQGLMLDPADWSGSTIGNVPIGQGLGVTAVQLASAYATIANDGVSVQPHLLKQVEGEAKPSYTSHRVISKKTAKTMQKILGDVVTDERGTGAFAKIPGYDVAGKTGTANKAENGIYAKGKYSSSFVGFVPANNPRLVTLIVVDEPNVPWGGTVAAPAFERITQFALQYLAIPPDGRV